MKKFTLLFLLFLYSLTGYCQFPEGFEGSTTSLPTGWNQYQNGAGVNQVWKISSLITTPPFICDGLNSAFIDRENALGINEDYLVTPQFVVPINGQLRFFSRQAFIGDQNTEYEVRISTNPDPSILSAYTFVKKWTEFEMNTTFNICQEQTLSISTYAGQTVHLAFVRRANQIGTAITGDRWLIDRVNVVQECFAPTLGNSTNIGATTATLNWTSPTSTMWDLEVVPVAGNVTGVPNIENVTPTGAIKSYNISGLLPNTVYKFFVRSDCSPTGETNTNTSAWVGPFIFQTLPFGATCAGPIAVSTLPYQNTQNTSDFFDFVDATQGTTACGATPSTTNYMSGNEVFYSYTAAQSGLVSFKLTPTSLATSMFVYAGCPVGGTCLAGVANANNTVRKIDNFAVTAGQTYIIVISSNATVAQTTVFTLLIQTENCTPPVGTVPTVTDLTTTTANLTWTNPTAASSWEYIVQPLGSPIPAGVGTTATSNTGVLVQDLTSGTQYQYFVRSECAPGVFSSWAGPYAFNTVICADADKCSHVFRMTDSANNGWNGARMEVRQNGIVIATIGATYTAGAGPVEVPVMLCKNVPFDLYWSVAGTQPAQCVVAVINSFGQTLYTKTAGQSGVGLVVYNNIVNCETPVCNIAPTGVQAININTYTATIIWTSPATTIWDVYVVPSGSPAPTSITIPTYEGITPATPTLDIAGLLADHAYDVYVRVQCSPFPSDWSVVKTFTTLATCPKPTALSVVNIGTTSAVFNWTNGTPTDTAWEVLLIPGWPIAPTAPPLDPIITNGTQLIATSTAAPFLINTLQPATIYYYYVRNVCPGNDKSTWAGPIIFNTITCDAIDKCVYKFVLTDSGSNGWNGARMQVRQNGILITTIGNTLSGAGPTTVNVSICNSVPFDLYWSVAGTAPDEVGISIQNPFTDIIYTKQVGVGNPTEILYSSVGNCVPPTCPKPTTLTATTITQTTAVLGWTENAIPSATQWEVYVVPIGSTLPINGQPVSGTGAYHIASTNPYTITGLLPATQYIFYVRALCSATDASTWTILSPKIFITKPVNDECDFATILPVNTGKNCLLFSEGTTLGATRSLPNTAPVCPGNTDDDVWFSFVATANIHIISINNIVGTATDMNHTLYSGNNCATMTQLYCSNPNVSVVNNLVIGNTYKIRVYSNGAVATQWSKFEVCITTPPPITNDDCATAISAAVNNGLECVVVTAGTVTGATASGGNVSCVGSEDDDVWFSFVATADHHYFSLINVVGTSTDLNFAVYGDNCSSLTSLLCSPAASLAADKIGFIVGQTYFVRVWSNAVVLQDVNFELCIGKVLPPIITNTTQYTKQQLIEDVLLGTSCASVTNITFSTGTGFGSANGIGYFNKAGSEFAFQDGIILSTGSVDAAPGPNLTIQSAGVATWPGDTDLEAIILAGTGEQISTLNATEFEFDFIPLSNQISFNFIFAAEEYGTFQCLFEDSFAFILTNNVTNETTNLALVPNTTTPITVTKIRDSAHNTSCDSVNPQYFGSFYGDTGINPLGAPINFNGDTIPMTAFSQVTPGVQYHIKMVIADKGDYLFDSAVFLEGGSFDIGKIELGGDFLLTNGNAVCQDDTITIDSGLNPLLYTFTWYLNSNEIPNEHNSVLLVNQAGVYTVVAQYINSTCIGTDSIIVDFFQEEVAGPPIDLIKCTDATTGVFDLTQNALAILYPFAIVHDLKYYASQADALADTNPILLPDTYQNVSNPQTIFVTVKNSFSSCKQIVSFDIKLQDLTPIYTLTGDLEICPLTDTTITVVPTDNNFDVNTVDISWKKAGVLIPNQSSASLVIHAIDGAGIYSVTVDNAGCLTSQEFEIKIKSTLDANFSYDALQYCKTATTNPVLNLGTATLGTFSYTATPTSAILALDTITGAIDLSNSDYGNYIIINTVTNTNGCANTVSTPVNLTIFNPPIADFHYQNLKYCIGGTNPSPIFDNGGVAGLFSSNAVGLIVDQTTGVIDLLNSVVGTYTVTNSIAASLGCIATMAQTSVVLSLTQNPNFDYDALAYCQNNPNPVLLMDVNATIGLFSASSPGLALDPDSGAINLLGSTPGTYTVVNTIAANNGCSEAISPPITITITPAPVATFHYAQLQYCSNNGNPTPILDGLAGVFSAPIGLTIDPMTGVVDIANSTAGTYTITNTIVAAGGCSEEIKTTTFTITTLPVANFSYSALAYCQNDVDPQPIYATNGVAGVFVASNPGLFINPTTGQIDLLSSTAGIYTVTNSIAASAGCQEVVSTVVSVAITAVPQASFNYGTGIYCRVIGTASPIFVGTATAGVFSAIPAGLSLNTSTGKIDLQASTAGTYTITNTIIAAGGCALESKESTIKITEPATGSIAYSSPICISTAALQNVTNTAPATGLYSTTAGLSLDTTTGAIDPTTSSAGSYTIKYTIAASQGCEAFIAQTDIEIIEQSIISLASGCDMNDYKIVATPSNNSFDLATSSFVWTGTSSSFEVVPTASNTIILHASGTYTATVTTLDGCVASLPIVIADVSCSIQKGISPNGDGDNETLDLTSFNVKDIKIFNRYGTQVYALENYTNQWHGQSNDGSTLSDGTYFYVIQKGDNSTVTGWIYINK